MTEGQFAAFNYYLEIAGVLALIAPLGLLLTCHTKLPQLLANNDDDGVSTLTGTAKSTILLTGVLVLVCGHTFAGGSPGLYLGVVQSSLFALFVIDQIVIKSRLDMLAYAGNVLARNLLIAAAGVIAFWLLDAAAWAMAGEAVAMFVW